MAASPQPGLAGITAAGPNNAAGSWNRRNLFTYTDGVTITKGIHQISAGVWFQRLRDNEDSASRQTGQATFASLTTLLQGTTSSFQIIPNPNELGWRSLYGAWYVQDAIRLRPHLTLQHRLARRNSPRVGMRSPAGRRTTSRIRTGALQTNVRMGGSAFTKNNATHLFAPRVGARLGSIRQRQDSGSRVVRHVLFADRQFELSAELAAAGQRRG